ncbi:hypothetical protein BLNAU_11939 [Blattamonas nauphoetae]|uniref:Uncharacterized protein n=1 Tax=Blattamonas nauphoetae TaxID=2049346 RepID=A0ABQ9XL43_9EUKA|nr:hypothetical protein BLNAU_11939 [Blattamonas nauphoetae]
MDPLFGATFSKPGHEPLYLRDLANDPTSRVMTAILCGGASEKNPSLGSEFYPLLLISGERALSMSFLRWFTKSYDCHVMPFQLSPFEMRSLAERFLCLPLGEDTISKDMDPLQNPSTAHSKSSDIQDFIVHLEESKKLMKTPPNTIQLEMSPPFVLTRAEIHTIKICFVPERVAEIVKAMIPKQLLDSLSKPPVFRSPDQTTQYVAPTRKLLGQDSHPPSYPKVFENLAIDPFEASDVLTDHTQSTKSFQIPQNPTKQLLSYKEQLKRDGFRLDDDADNDEPPDDDPVQMNPVQWNVVSPVLFRLLSEVKKAMAMNIDAYHLVNFNTQDVSLSSDGRIKFFHFRAIRRALISLIQLS